MDGLVLLIGKLFLNCEKLYDLNGLHSKALGVKVVNKLSVVLESWPLNNVLIKALKIPVIHNNSPIESFGIVSLINFGLE
jgi:hypothetical protein